MDLTFGRFRGDSEGWNAAGKLERGAEEENPGEELCRP